MINQVLLDMVKRSFVAPGVGGDPAAMGVPPGGDPNAAPPPGGQPMPAGDPNAATAAPAPPPGLDPAIIQQIVQAVQGAGGGGAAKPKGAGKNDETTQQLYKLNVLLMAIAKQLSVEIPDEMFLGPPPGDQAAQQQAAPPAEPAQDPNAAAQPQMMNVAPSVAMPKMAADIVPTFGSSFSIADTPEKPVVDVPMPKQADQQPPPSTTTKAAALVSLLRSLNRG